MKTYPQLPNVEDAPDELFERGHLWLQELLDGAHVRFQLRESGVIRFGDRIRVFDPDDVPLPYRHVVRHVRERLDRTALRDAVEDVEDVVFFGEAMHVQKIEYDWDRTPSFLGFDVWSDDTGRFLTPDAVQQIYRRLGLTSVDVFAQEVRATDFDPDSYDVPDSNWYDGPAAGVVVRNKRGSRATLSNPAIRAGDDAGSTEAAADPSAAGLVDQYGTDRRFETLTRRLRDRDRPVTFDALYELAIEGVERAAHPRFDGADSVDVGEFRSAMAARTREFLADRS